MADAVNTESEGYVIKSWLGRLGADITTRIGATCPWTCLTSLFYSWFHLTLHGRLLWRSSRAGQGAVGWCRSVESSRTSEPCSDSAGMGPPGSPSQPYPRRSYGYN